MRRVELLGLIAGIVALAASTVHAEAPGGFEAAKTLAAEKDLPLLVKFSSEF